MADIIQVLPDETLDGLVAKVTALAGNAPTEPVLLWVPRGVAILHQMEDFQALKGVMRRQGMQIKILSPDARVVGLGKVFGVEAETTAQLPGTVAPEATRPPAPGTAPAPPVAPDTISAPPPSAGARRPSTTPLPPAAPPPAVPPAPSRRPTTSPLPAPATPPEPEVMPGVSETDWLLGDGGNLDALLNDAEHTGRSATPPPDVLLPGMAPPQAGPPAAPPAGPPSTGAAPDSAAPADTDWLTTGADLDALAAGSLNPDALPAPPPADSAFPPPAAPFAGAPVPPPNLPAAPPARPPATDPFAASFEQVPPFYMDPEPPAEPPAAPPASKEAPPPTDSFSLSDLLQAGEEEGGGPPMSFAEWLALQSSNTAARAGSTAPPPDVDLDNLPAWMRPEPPAPAPPVPPATPAPSGRKGVLRCPHCGEELDKEEMLRMLAEVWGLDS